MILYVSIKICLEIHDDLINSFGGAKGLRDYGLLLSALEMPKATFGGQELHPTLFDKAAAYLYHIAKNHPFIDGNKRAASATALTFLEMNRCLPMIDSDEYEELVVSVAEGIISKKDIACFFELKKPSIL